MKKIRAFTITTNEDNKRLDKVLRPLLAEKSMGSIFQALRKKDILLNGKKAKGSDLVKAEDIITIKNPKLFPNMQITEPKNPTEKQKTSLPPVVWQNDHIVFFNKPRGLVVQGNNSLDTMVKESLSIQESLTFRPGPLHRIDKNTSGLVAFSKSLKGAREFSTYIQTRNIKKYYLGLVEGSLNKKILLKDQIIQENGNVRIESSVYAKEAVTICHPILCSSQATLVVFEILTGRKHQIRVQTSHNGHPLWGDKKYGSIKNDQYLLHAAALFFPETNEVLSQSWIICPLENNWQSFLKRTLNLKANFLERLYNIEELKKIFVSIQQVGDS